MVDVNKRIHDGVLAAVQVQRVDFDHDKTIDVAKDTAAGEAEVRADTTGLMDLFVNAGDLSDDDAIKQLTEALVKRHPADIIAAGGGTTTSGKLVLPDVLDAISMLSGFGKTTFELEKMSAAAADKTTLIDALNKVTADEVKKCEADASCKTGAAAAYDPLKAFLDGATWEGTKWTDASKIPADLKAAMEVASKAFESGPGVVGGTGIAHLYSTMDALRKFSFFPKRNVAYDISKIPEAEQNRLIALLKGLQPAELNCDNATTDKTQCKRELEDFSAIFQNAVGLGDALPKLEDAFKYIRGLDNTDVAGRWRRHLELLVGLDIYFLGQNIYSGYSEGALRDGGLFVGLSGGDNAFGKGFGFMAEGGYKFPLPAGDATEWTLTVGVHGEGTNRHVKSADDNLKTKADYDDVFVGPYVKAAIGGRYVKFFVQVAPGVWIRNGSNNPLNYGRPRSKDTPDNDVTANILDGVFLGMMWAAGLLIFPGEEKDGGTIGFSVGGTHIIAPTPDREITLPGRTITDMETNESYDVPSTTVHLTAPRNAFFFRTTVGF